MPVRDMMYDSLGYLKECQVFAANQKKTKEKLTPEEFLSKMKKTDRLHPILTLNIYYGEKAWDGPLSLKDMFIEIPEELSSLIPDYKIHLLEVRDSGEYIFHNEDVQTVFEITRETFFGHFKRLEEKYRNRNLSREIGQVIGTLTGFDTLIKEEQEGEIDMCTALEQLKQEYLEQGVERGIEQGIEEERQKNIRSMYENGIEIKEIASILNQPLEYVEMVCNQQSQDNL